MSMDRIQAEHHRQVEDNTLLVAVDMVQAVGNKAVVVAVVEGIEEAKADTVGEVMVNNANMKPQQTKTRL